MDQFASAEENETVATVDIPNGSLTLAELSVTTLSGLLECNRPSKFCPPFPNRADYQMDTKDKHNGFRKRSIWSPRLRFPRRESKIYLVNIWNIYSY